MSSNEGGAYILVGIIIGALFMLLCLNAVGNTYKKGQIDYANGIIKYELVTQGDKTVRWQTKPEK